MPLFNIGHFGMDAGDTPFHGYYFGKREESGLAVVGVVFNLGSMFFHALNEDAVSGMAEHIIAAGKPPFFAEGPKSHIERLLAELEGKYDATPKPLLCERLLLRGGVNPDISTSGVRPSRLEDIDILTTLGRAMHREMFGAEGMDKHSFHELLRLRRASTCGSNWRRPYSPRRARRGACHRLCCCPLPAPPGHGRDNRAYGRARQPGCVPHVHAHRLHQGRRLDRRLI